MKKSMVLFLLTMTSFSTPLMAERVKEIPATECDNVSYQRMEMVPDTQKELVIQAAKKWCLRDASALGKDNAQKAANLFSQLANSTPDSEVLLKGEYLLRQSEAIYFVGDVSTSIEEKKSVYELGFKVAEQGFTPLEKLGVSTLDDTQLTMLAELYYYYAANKGRWGEANGILNSLKEWPGVKAKMEKIIELGKAEVFNYGPNRVLGRAYFKLPFPLGSNKKALELLGEAFENTLHDELFTSVHGVNNYFYADALISDGQKDLAREILEGFRNVGDSLESLKSYNPDRMPETLYLDLVEADKVYGRL